MKKIVCFVIVFAIFSALFMNAYAEDQERTKYFTYSLNTFGVANEIEEKIIEMGEIENPTEEDAKLCLLYVEVHTYLYYLATEEMRIVDGDFDEDRTPYDGVIDLVNQMRDMLKYELLSPKEIISSFADAFKKTQ